MIKNLLFTTCFLVAAFAVNAQQYSFIYDGIERTYRLFVPDADTRVEPYPMVINMHGLGSNALEQQVYSQFDNVGDTAGVVVVYPNGVNNQWNIYSETGVDDVGFISALIDTIAAHYSIDLSRVYATGMSMGGFMSHRLACQLNHRIAAIGPVAGTLAYPFCSPGRAVPVCQIHGTADSVVFYYLVPITMEYWTGNNGCSDSVVTELPDIDTTDFSTVTITTYTPCDEDVEVLLYTINGGGHTWPGAPINIGITNHDIHASAELWKFFSKYSLPEWVDIGGHVAESSLKVYPNPVNQNAVIEVSGTNNKLWQLRVLDISGRIVREEAVKGEKRIAFVRNGLRSGMYILELSSGETVMRERIIMK